MSLNCNAAPNSRARQLDQNERYLPYAGPRVATSVALNACDMLWQPAKRLAFGSELDDSSERPWGGPTMILAILAILQPIRALLSWRHPRLYTTGLCSMLTHICPMSEAPHQRHCERVATPPRTSLRSLCIPSRSARLTLNMSGFIGLNVHRICEDLQDWMSIERVRILDRVVD